MNSAVTSLRSAPRWALALGGLGGAVLALAWICGCIRSWTYIVLYQHTEPFGTPGFLALLIGVPAALVGLSFVRWRSTRARKLARAARSGFVYTAILGALAIVSMIFSMGL